MMGWDASDVRTGRGKTGHHVTNLPGGIEPGRHPNRGAGGGGDAIREHSIDGLDSLAPAFLKLHLQVSSVYILILTVLANAALGFSQRPLSLDALLQLRLQPRRRSPPSNTPPGLQPATRSKRTRLRPSYCRRREGKKETVIKTP